MAYKGKFVPKNSHKYKGNVNNIIWRSTWERGCFRWADNNPDVVQWSSEETVIPYISPVDNKMHRYFVDLTITFKSGQTLLIEVKPKYQTEPPKINKKPKGKKGEMRLLQEAQTFAVNDAKWKAADVYAKKNNMKFVIFTENELEMMGIHTFKR